MNLKLKGGLYKFRYRRSYKTNTPFTILNRNFHGMDLIRDAMKNRRLATEKLQIDYREIYKNHQFA